MTVATLQRMHGRHANPDPFDGNVDFRTQFPTDIVTSRASQEILTGPSGAERTFGSFQLPRPAYDPDSLANWGLAAFDSATNYAVSPIANQVAQVTVTPTGDGPYWCFYFDGEAGSTVTLSGAVSPPVVVQPGVENQYQGFSDSSTPTYVARTPPLTGGTISVTLTISGAVTDLQLQGRPQAGPRVALKTSHGNRRTDDASVKLGDWFNPMAGTFAVDFVPTWDLDNPSSAAVIQLDDGTSNNRLVIRVGAQAAGSTFGVLQEPFKLNGVTTPGPNSALTVNWGQVNRAVMVYDYNVPHVGQNLNNGTPQWVTVPGEPQLTVLRFGNTNSGSPLDGYILRAQYEPFEDAAAFSAAVLADL